MVTIVAIATIVTTIERMAMIVTIGRVVTMEENFKTLPDLRHRPDGHRSDGLRGAAERGGLVFLDGIFNIAY